jgi:DNA-binding MarR family transcriptional regulator
VSIKNEDNVLEKIDELLQKYKLRLTSDSRVLKNSINSEPDVGLINPNIRDSEKEIFDYIVAHPSVTKQVLVNHFYGRYSRMTVFKNLDRLAAYGMIEQNRNPENRQSYDLKVNEESLLVQLIANTNSMKNTFLNQLKDISNFGSINHLNKNQLQKIQESLFDITKSVSAITNRFLMQILFDSKEESKNRNTIAIAYGIVFSSLSTILTEATTLYHKFRSSLPYPESVAKRSSELKLDKQRKLSAILRLMDVASEILPVTPDMTQDKEFLAIYSKINKILSEERQKTITTT